MKLSIKEYMESRGISRRTIYNRIENGQLETVKEKNKTYIIKEILTPQVPKKGNSDNKRESNKNEFDNTASLENLYKLKNMTEDLIEKNSVIQDSYEIIKNFDYKFLKERLSSIEKSLITFTMEANASNERINLKIEKFSKEISEKLNEIMQKNNSFLENLLLINEKNQEFFKDSIENIENRISNIEKQLEKVDKIDYLIEKFEEIVKSNDKKGFGIFKK